MNTHEAIMILRNTAWLGTNEDREKAEQAIEVVAEALEREPKRGKWIQSKDVEIEYAVCTKCKQHGEFYMRYCPNCGARMESDAE